MEIIIFIAQIVIALFCALVANEKGYSNIAWFFGGILFSFIALIAVAGLPDKRLRKYLRQIGEKQNAIEPEIASDDVQKQVNKINKKTNKILGE